MDRRCYRIDLDKMALDLFGVTYVLYVHFGPLGCRAFLGAVTAIMTTPYGSRRAD